MNKYVTNYWVEELPNGVISLTINCTQKEIYYHAYNHYEFFISNKEIYSKDQILVIPEFLPKLEKTTWLMSSQKEKDQLSFYYIPYKHEWIKNRKYLIEPK